MVGLLVEYLDMQQQYLYDNGNKGARRVRAG